MAKTRGTGLSLVLSASVLTAVLAPAASATDEPPQTVKQFLAQHQSVPAVPDRVPVVGTVPVPKYLKTVAAPVVESCTELSARLADLAAQGVKSAVCEPEAEPEQGQTAGRSATAQELCADNAQGTWWYNRTAVCHSEIHLVDTLEVPSGKNIGKASYRYEHGIALDVINAAFYTFTRFNLLSATGPSPANIVSSKATCSGCNGAKSATLFTKRAMVQGEDLYGSGKMSDDPSYPASATYVHDNLYVQWSDSFTCTGCSSPADVAYKFPKPVRCDSQAKVNGIRQGCVVPAYIPELQITGFNSGQTSAAFVNFIQTHGAEHWGRRDENGNGNKLTRSGGPDAEANANVNRTAMCRGFIANPAVKDDSCDEFPFAQSRESGNQRGLTADDCTKVTPMWSDALKRWTFVLDPGSAQGRSCGIGHVVRGDNTDIGGDLGRLTQDNRIVDGDTYWVGIYV